MWLREVAEIKGEINWLWKEHFKIVEENEGCCDSPQKERAKVLMRELFKKGDEEDRRWIRETEAKIKWQAARIYQAAGKLFEAEELLKKVQRLLDRYPEIGQNLKCCLEKIERKG